MGKYKLFFLLMIFLCISCGNNKISIRVESALISSSDNQPLRSLTLENDSLLFTYQISLKTLRWFAQVAGGAKPPRNVALWQVYAIVFSVKIQTSLVRFVCLPMTDCMMNSRKALLSMLSIRKATAMTSSRLYTS